MKRIKSEFHIHTNYSKDSILNSFFLFIMCKLKGIKLIAITDHNEIAGAIKIKDKFEKKGINVIVGEEILTRDGEIIGLYLNKKIPENLSAKETIKEIKKQDGFVYIPHPYDEKRNRTVLKPEILKEIYKEVDFIEIHNGRNIKEEYSNIQYEISKKYNLRKIIGSDSHTFFELGRNYCLIENYEKDKLLQSIENAIFKKKKCIKSAHFCTKIARIIKLIGKGEFDEIIRIIRKKITSRK